MRRVRKATPLSCSTCGWRRATRRYFSKDWMRKLSAASRLHQNAVIRSLEVIGEAAGKVSPAKQARHPEIPWRDIIGMRHRLIHGYAEVRLDLVWLVAQQRLGPLIAALAPLIPGDDAAGP